MKALRLPHADRVTVCVGETLSGISRGEETQQMEYIAFDAHKHYTLASVARADGRLVREQRLTHERGAFQQFLARCEPGSPVALETVGNWYWIVDEIETAGCVPSSCTRARRS